MQEYAAAQERWEAHKKQVATALTEVIEPVAAEAAGSTFSSDSASAGALADDAALAALKAQLEGN